mgnify:CR=1 FL=1
MHSFSIISIIDVIYSNKTPFFIYFLTYFILETLYFYYNNLLIALYILRASEFYLFYIFLINSKRAFLSNNYRANNYILVKPDKSILINIILLFIFIYFILFLLSLSWIVFDMIHTENLFNDDNLKHDINNNMFLYFINTFLHAISQIILVYSISHIVYFNSTALNSFTTIFYFVKKTYKLMISIIFYIFIIYLISYSIDNLLIEYYLQDFFGFLVIPFAIIYLYIFYKTNNLKQ